jgi:Lon protease-like protein
MPLPLHVFEPRYRKMVTDVRTGHGTIGMVLLRPGWEPFYYGRPPIFPIGCAGRLEQCESLPDGRFDIVLRGLTRFIVAAEHAGEPYRLAHVDPQAETPDPPEALAQVKSDLIAAIGQLRHNEAIELQGDLPPGLLINALSQSLDLQPLERQSLLDCDGAVARGRRLIEILQFKRLERDSGSTRVH